MLVECKVRLQNKVP